MSCTADTRIHNIAIHNHTSTTNTTAFSRPTAFKYPEASLAQLVEHALRKRMVAGSIPAGGSYVNSTRLRAIHLFAGAATSVIMRKTKIHQANIEWEGGHMGAVTTRNLRPGSGPSLRENPATRNRTRDHLIAAKLLQSDALPTELSPACYLQRVGGVGSPPGSSRGRCLPALRKLLKARSCQNMPEHIANT